MYIHSYTQLTHAHIHTHMHTHTYIYNIKIAKAVNIMPSALTASTQTTRFHIADTAQQQTDINLKGTGVNPYTR